ncbi:MAG: glycosyltransferase family 2 protein [Mitsuokella sp.]
MQDLISIIIPVYNTEAYLAKCLQSACDQTYRNLEIICVDDGSTDGSGAIVDAFAERDARVKAIHRENGGESAARNTGIRAATGAYIGFMDCDDWIEPDMYEVLLRALRESHADIAACRYFKDEEKRGASREVCNALPVLQDVWGRSELLRYVYQRDAYRGVTGYIWCKLYRAEVLRDAAGGWTLFDETLALGGDILYFAEAALRAKRTIFLDKAYYHYLQRETSGFHSRDERKWQQMIVTYERLLARLAEEGISEDILIWVKRFLVYRGEVVAKLSYQNGNPSVLASSQAVMRRYGEEYLRTNADHPERIREYHEILDYHL